MFGTDSGPPPVATGKHGCRKVQVHPTECSQTAWERSLKKWELLIPCFEELLWEERFGTRSLQFPSHFEICTSYAPNFSSPTPNLPQTLLSLTALSFSSECRENAPQNQISRSSFPELCQFVLGGCWGLESVSVTIVIWWASIVNLIICHCFSLYLDLRQDRADLTSKPLSESGIQLQTCKDNPCGHWCHRSWLGLQAGRPGIEWRMGLKPKMGRIAEKWEISHSQTRGKKGQNWQRTFFRFCRHFGPSFPRFFPWALFHCPFFPMFGVRPIFHSLCQAT